MKSVFISSSKVNGIINIPASKSILHRALICAFLSKGKSVIKNFYLSNDIKATINAITSLGSKVVFINENEIEVTGINDFNSVNAYEFDIYESASTLRFILPILTFFKGRFKIKGSINLFKRPLNVYLELFKLNGIDFKIFEDYCLIEGSLKNNSFKIDGSISSQFSSGLLFSLPLLQKKAVLEVINPESINYTLLTINMLNNFGVKIKNYYNTKFVFENESYYHNTNIFIEGDYSQAANFFILGTLNNDLKIEGLNFNSLQMDSIITKTLNNIKYENGIYDVQKKSYDNLEFDIKNTPDIGPILMVLLTKTGGVIKNINRLKYKESDRLNSMILELSKLGVNIKVIVNDCFIVKKELIKTNKIINSHNDHRIFMAMAILATISQDGFLIDDFTCIEKSYPTFLRDLVKIGGSVKYK